jgi:hypothetical protein
MRRILIVLTLAAAVVGIHACAADSPTAPKPGGGGGQTSNAVSVQLFTSNPNPPAGTCTLIEAIVSFNGSPVPDGTTVNFTTDFGTFGANGLALVSVVTTGGTAPVALCGPGAGTAHVKASVTVQSKSNSAQLSVTFQSSSNTLPFVSFCSPSFGPKDGGTVLVLNGGRFFGSPSTTRVVFTVNGVSKDGVVQAVTATQITVQTPGFPEVTAPSAQAPITLILGTNQPTPVTLSLPACFVFGTADNGTPVVTAVLPSSGTNEGNTRVTVIGSGFASTAGGVQVFFGTTEATVVSVSFNQVIVLSPPAFGAGAGNLNQSVPVTVKNISSGIVSNATVNYSYTPAVKITAVSNGTQSLGFLSPVTIFGQGFSAPVAVTLAGIPALVTSVTATEIVCVPGTPLLASCANITGVVNVVNIDTGDGASGAGFTYVVPKPVITSVVPGNSCPDGGTCSTDNNGTGGLPVTINGSGFPASINTTQVKFGAQTAFVSNTSTTSQLNVTSPVTSVAPPTCGSGVAVGTPAVAATVDVTVTDLTSTCSVTATQAFQYVMPCVAPTTGP